MPEVTNYLYVADHFDERLFNISEGVRDIPVGFHGSIHRNRPEWLKELRKLNIPIYTADEKLLGKDTPAWVSYERYCRFMSRLKVVFNFASRINPKPAREQILQTFYQNPIKTYLRLKLIIASKPNQSSIVQHITSVLTNLTLPTRYQVGARVWEALWLRTFLLEEENPVTASYFDPYVDYVPFTTLQDLADKIRYYLENEEERDRIRMHGRATVEKYYNARIYWENVFETIGIQSDTKHCHRPGEIWNKEYLDKWYLSHPSSVER